MMVTPNLSAEGVRAVLDGPRAAATRCDVTDPWPDSVAALSDSHPSDAGVPSGKRRQVGRGGCCEGEEVW